MHRKCSSGMHKQRFARLLGSFYFVLRSVWTHQQDLPPLQKCGEAVPQLHVRYKVTYPKILINQLPSTMRKTMNWILCIGKLDFAVAVFEKVCSYQYVFVPNLSLPSLILILTVKDNCKSLEVLKCSKMTALDHASPPCCWNNQSKNPLPIGCRRHLRHMTPTKQRKT